MCDKKFNKIMQFSRVTFNLIKRRQAKLLRNLILKNDSQKGLASRFFLSEKLRFFVDIKTRRRLSFNQTQLIDTMKSLKSDMNGNSSTKEENFPLFPANGVWKGKHFRNK